MMLHGLCIWVLNITGVPDAYDRVTACRVESVKVRIILKGVDVMNSMVCDGEEGPTAKQWDHPLTTADMRARAADWSLADDSRLLAYLEAFTQSVTSRTREIQKQLEGLVYETQVSSVKVNNVINDFNHLNSLQFVENRVYDEEVKDGAELNDTRGDVQQQSSGDQEAALVQRVSEAFRLGVEVLRSSLEVIDLHQEGDSDDSDEEEGGGRERHEPLLRALDPYLARPLPPLIGSDRFLADDRVGLGELLSEDEADEKSSSHGEECEEEESDESEADSDLLLAKPKKPTVAVDNKMADYMQREFGGSQAESDEDVFTTADREELHSKSSSSSSDSELDSDGDKSAAVGRDASVLRRGSAPSPKRRIQDSTKDEEDALFGQSSTEDGPEGEKASPFVRKSGLFTGDGKLFDDDSDEGDLFRDVSTAKEQPSSTPNPPKLTASGKKIPAGGVSLFGGAGLPLPSERSDTKQEAQAHSASAGVSVRTDELASSGPEGEDEDSLFGSLKKEAPLRKQASGTGAVMPPDIFGSEKDTSDVCAMPKNSHSTGKPTVAPGGLFDADDDDDLWASAESMKAPQQERSVPSSQPVVVGGAKDLLREEPPPLQKAETTSSKAWKKHSMFDDEDEDDDFLFSAASSTVKADSKPAKSFLFDADDEDFFTSGDVKPSLSKAASHEAKPDSTGNSSATKSEPANRSRTASRGIFLFEDEDEPGKPSQAAPVPQEAPAAHPVEPAVSKPISLFTAEEEAAEDDEDLFSERTPPTHLADSQSSHSVQSASWSIGSKGEAEPASVIHAGTVPEEAVAKVRSGSRFLFDQEDELFKTSPDNNLDVDLFAPPKPNVTDSSPKKKPAGAVSLFGGSSLFGDELRSRLERSGMPAADSAGIPNELGQEEGDHLFAQSSALEPQSRPALRDTKVTSVSFDEPADQNKTLVSATKSRVKVKVKRRLPSRKKLQADAQQDGESGSPPAEPLPSRAPSAVINQEQPEVRLLHCAPSSDGTVAKESGEHDQRSRLAPLLSPQSAATMVKSPSTEEEDLFAVVENSLHPVPEVSQKPNPARPVPSVGTRLSQAPFAGSIFDDDGEEDLFTDHAPKSSPRLASWHEQTNAHGLSDAIFEAAQPPGDDSMSHHQTGDLESSSTTATPSEDTAKEVLPQDAPKGVSGSIFDDCEEDDDIFAPSAKATSSARSSRRKQDTLFDDDTDDIFSSKPVQPKVNKSDKKGSQPSSSAKKCLPRTTNFKDPLLGDLNDE